MTSPKSDPRALVLTFAAAWSRLERSLDLRLSVVRGIRFAEYRLLRALADAPGSRASRVELARAVGLTPSGVTRALRPLEKLRIVETERSERDARLALAKLTPAGAELVDDAERAIEDVMHAVLAGAGTGRPTWTALVESLAADRA